MPFNVGQWHAIFPLALAASTCTFDIGTQCSAISYVLFAARRKKGKERLSEDGSPTLLQACLTWQATHSWVDIRCLWFLLLLCDGPFVSCLTSVSSSHDERQPFAFVLQFFFFFFLFPFAAHFQYTVGTSNQWLAAALEGAFYATISSTENLGTHPGLSRYKIDNPTEALGGLHRLLRAIPLAHWTLLQAALCHEYPVP